MRAPGTSPITTAVAATANTAGNPDPAIGALTNMSPAKAIVTADPVESEIESAEELKPSSAGVEYASVSTFSRG